MQQKIKQLKIYNIFDNTLKNIMPFLIQVMYFVVGYLLTLARLPGNISPTSIAFCMAAPSSYSLSTAAGAVLGYAVGFSLLDASKYLSAICIGAVVRWIFQFYKNNKTLGVISSIVTLVVIHTAYNNYFTSQVNLGYVTAEILLVIGLTVVFSYLGFQENLFNITNTKQGVSLFVLLICLLTALQSVNISVVNIGFVVAGTFVLCLVYALAERGAVLGCLVVLSTQLFGGNLQQSLFLAVTITIAGLATAFFCKGERITLVLIYCATAFFSMPLAQNIQIATACLATCIFSCVLFLLIPVKFLHFKTYNNFNLDKKQATFMSQKISRLASALQDVGVAVKDVCEIYPKYKNKYIDPIEYACDTICVNCKNANKCWVENYNDTYDQLDKCVKMIKKQGVVCYDNIPNRIKKSCVDISQLVVGLNKGLALQMTEKTKTAQAGTLKQVLSEQYTAMADTLMDISGDVWHEQRVDTQKTQAVKKLFCEMELVPLETLVYTDNNKALCAVIKTERVQVTQNQIDAICSEVSHCCHHSFTACQPSHTAGVSTFKFIEKPLIKPRFDKYSLAADGEMSADVIDYFLDDKSNAHVILSDGMGTGKDASIDGNMVVAISHRLLSAGFKSDGVARLVNGAVALKSETETGATLDTLSVNLFTGDASLYKAGAVATFLVHKEKVQAITYDSLPIGTTVKVTGGIKQFKISPNDIVVMVSDGVTQLGEKNIKSHLSALCQHTDISIAKALCEYVQKNQTIKDDISVAVLKF